MLLPPRRAHGKPLAALALAAVALGVGAWFYGGPDAQETLPAQLGGADALCDPEFCGNGQLDPGEQCDDGNKSSNDSCSYPFCQVICTQDGDCPSGECVGGVCRELCGNGQVDPPICVSKSGPLTCPDPAPGDMRIVHLPGDGFSTAHANGDLNGDGRLDIVVGYFIGSGDQNATSFVATLQAYINKGNGDFEAKRLVGTFQWNRGGGQRGIDVADVDNDGDGDVLVYDGNAQGIVLLRNNDMEFSRSTVIPEQFAFYLYHGDANGDGDPELGMSGFGLGVGGVYGASVAAAAAGPAFDPPERVNSSNGYDSFRFADMNGDGNADVVVIGSAMVEPFGYGVTVHLSNGDGTFAEGRSMYQRAANPNVLSMDIGDVDKDGNLDVALAENGRDVVVILGDGQGGGTNHAIITFPFNTRFVALADPTADGVLDVIAGSGQGTEGKNLWLAAGNGNGTFAAPTRLLTVNAPPSGRPPFTWNDSYYYNYDLKAADYDGDGRLDLSVVHALSSNGASVIYFRSSLDGCTQDPPVVTCSQQEECDDGPSNGQPGKCTKRCTYCGNGQIDTVNGIAEACDEGDRNGEPGSGCTERCSLASVTEPMHTACVGNQCVLESGPGTNECTSDQHCMRTEHMGCVGVGACAIIQGPGMDTCATAGDCCDPSDPSCKHDQCDFIGETCAEVPGPGMPQCSSNNNCTAFHFSCENQQCSIQPGDGPDTCTKPEDCAPPVCINDGQCSANESCQCLDCIADARCDACVENTVCEAGESCACGDCADKSVCEVHTACENEQCMVKFGPGTNECMDPAVCMKTQHLACAGIGSCVIVDGPGQDTCTVATAEADCCDPADPFCTHRQCNPFTQSCVVVAGPSMDLCAGEDCTAFHSVCENEQCLMVEGPGESECLDSSMCAAPLCGNGTVDPGEQCDDGNDNNNDACSNVCELRCGNGVIEEGEDCDEGAGNRTDPPGNLAEWYCRALSCTRSICFDDGDNDGDQWADEDDAGCWQYDLSQLRAERRGGGLLGFLIGQQGDVLLPVRPELFLPGKGDEACPAEMLDRGSMCMLRCEPGDICPTGDACPADGVCPPTCGNQVIDFSLGEECDDGNLNDDDACRNNCRLAPCEGASCPRCGDGIYHPTIGEQCDTGGASATCTANCRTPCDGDEDCPGACDLEVGACKPPLCGDGEVNQPWERCDDGNVDDMDSCNNQCQPTCNDDPDCESGKCDKAKLVCVPLCGNGRADAGEQCDDGNMINNDTCSNRCERTCTDDSTCDCDEDRGVCRPLCGNGRIDPGEGCDDGNREDRDSCNNTCLVRCRPGTMCPDNQACPQNGLCPPPAFCGDGVVHATEQCDDANNVDTDACTNGCQMRCTQNLECPNGLLCLGEVCAECSSSLQCDNGFCVDGRCRQALPICGNGVVEAGEACDDANGDDTDGCTTSCLFPRDHACAASAQCQTRLCEAGTCQPCSDPGQCGSGLRCSQGNCLFGSEQCGDGVVQAGEACDDANMNEQDQCTTACLRPFGQSCDHASQCASTICSGGACTPCRSDNECSGGTRCAIGLCLTDTQMSLLPNVCGNGLLEAGEACDDGNNRYGDGCTPGCSVGNAPVRAEVAANVTVQLPFAQGTFGGGQGPLHGGAGDGLSDTGPAAVALMAAGAAAGTAWVRRRRKGKRA